MNDKDLQLFQIGLKHGVESSFQPATWIALSLVNDVLSVSIGVPLVITSGSEVTSTHGPENLHYSGRAFDIRTRFIRPYQRRNVCARLKQRLAPYGFDVVDEGDHIHIEYDPKIESQALIQEGVD